MESKNWPLVRAYTGWRRYEIDTSFNRVIELRESIDLIELSLEIERLSKKLEYIYQKKNGRYNDEHHE